MRALPRLRIDHLAPPAVRLLVANSPRVADRARQTLLVLLLQTLAGCGVAQNDYQAVVRERDSLRVQLEDIKNGPSRLLASARAAVEARKFDEARDISRQLQAKHPASAEAKEVVPALQQAEDAIAERAIAAKKAQELAEKAHLDSLKAQEARIARSLTAMRRSYDSVREIAWYYDRSVPKPVNTGSRMLLYIGKPNDGSPFLRFSIRYASDEWLFIQSYTVKADAQTFRIDVSGYDDVERDNGYGGIWEWYDTTADTQELEIVRAVVNSKRAVLRYNGKQYYHDRTIGADEKAALQRVLDAYDALQRG